MTKACKPAPGTAERSEWQAGYLFTSKRVHIWNDDTAEEDLAAALERLASQSLTPLQVAYWHGVLCAANEALGTPCSCDAPAGATNELAG